MCLQSCPAAIPTGHCPAPRAAPAQGLNLGVWGCLTIPSVLNGNCQALNSTDTTNLPTSLGGTGTTPGKVANSLNCKGSAGAMPEARLGLLGPGVVGPCQLRDPVLGSCGLWIHPLLLLGVAVGWAQWWLPCYVRRRREGQIHPGLLLFHPFSSAHSHS